MKEELSKEDLKKVLPILEKYLKEYFDLEEQKLSDNKRTLLLKLLRLGKKFIIRLIAKRLPLLAELLIKNGIKV